MDENDIFKPIDKLPNDAGIEPEAVINNPYVSSPPNELPSSPPPSKIFNGFKIFLGVIVVIAVIVFAFNIILPKLFPSAVGKVTLTYWGLFEDSSVISPIIADFEKQYPNIKVEYVKQDLDRYKDKLVTRSSNGTGPDIFRFHNTWVPQLLGILLPIPGSIVSKDDFAKNYYPVMKKDLEKNGVIYGIPLEIDTLNLFVNKNLFQAAGLKVPSTWIDFVSVARQMTVKDENNSIKTAGAAMGTSNNVTHAPDIVSMLFAQNGVDLNNIASNVPAAGDALKFYSSFAKPPDNAWDDTLDQSIKVFASGSLAMYFGYSWDFFTIKSMNPNLSFDIYPVPSLPGQNISIASYWVEGISGKSKHQKEATLFLQYLASKEAAQKLFAEESKIRNFGEPYARLDLAGSLTNSIAYPFIASAPSAVSTYFVDGTMDNGINSQINKYLNTAIDSVLGGSNPQDEADTLSKGASKVLKQYGL
jgi:ABC-type glycerol-3-phosphate transport system substrate-binding protein